MLANELLYSYKMNPHFLKVPHYEIDEQSPEGWRIQFEINISNFCVNRKQQKSCKMSSVQ